MTNHNARQTAATYALEAGELDLVHRFWPKAFISERFILDSKDAYPLPWMVREIVQNFLDHGQPLSLDDVTLQVRSLPEQRTQIVVTGAWRFAQRGTVLALHGTKGADDAGANAIGLKQVLIRCCRDFGVSRFSIQGDGWDVNYHLASAEEINARLQDQGESKRVQFGWLVPDEVGASPRPHACHYVIESNHPELVAAFGDFFNMGVHSNNPFLLLPDFANQSGMLKWRRDNQPGRLFVKGQVMNFRRPGPLRNGHGADYWRGPEGVSLSLPQARYRKSIDRPAISEFELGILAGSLIDRMTREELVSQLKASAHLWSRRAVWSGPADRTLPSSKSGFLIIVRRMVDQLQHPRRGDGKFSRGEYAQVFGARNYVCLDEKADDEQATELEQQGYRVCPAFFELIHMPRVSDQFDAVANAKNHQPDPDGSARKLDHLARQTGIPVGFDRFEIAGTTAYLQLIKDRLDRYLDSVLALDKNTIRCRFQADLTEKLLSHPLYAAKTEEQKLLFGCRTLVANGLLSGICNGGFLSQGKRGSTFAIGRDETLDEPTLISATVDIGRAQGVFLDLEFAPNHFEFFRIHLTQKYDLTPAECAGEPLTPAADAADPGPADSSATVDAMDSHTASQRASQPDTRGDLARLWKQPIVTFAATALVALVMAIVALLDLSGWRVRALAERIALAQDRSEALPTPAVPAGDAPARPVDQQAHDAPDSGSASSRVSQPGPGSPTLPAHTDDLLETVRQLLELGESTPLPAEGSRAAGQFYQEHHQYSLPAAEHLDGQQVNDLTAGRSTARIDPLDLSGDIRAQQLLSLQDAVDGAMDRLAEDHVQDFQIVSSPQAWQLAKLELLRSYAHETTGVAVANALFIYQGSGASGINIDGVGIGIHEQLLSGPFSEAMGTFIHEIAHNGARGHGVRFEQVVEALFLEMNDKLTDIARKARAGVALTPQEHAVLASAERWRR